MTIVRPWMRRLVQWSDLDLRNPEKSRRIREYKNDGDYDVLCTPTRPVTADMFGTKELENMIGDAFEATDSNLGAGLAANRIGLPYSFFVASYEDVDGEWFRMAYVNPEIVSKSGKIRVKPEGCLSLRWLKPILVPRYEKLVVRYRKFDGEIVEEKVSGFLARLFQHEMDHLEGKNELKNAFPRLF